LLNSLAWQPVDRIAVAAAANAASAAFAALSGLVSLSILASLQSAFLAFFFLCDVMLQQQLGSTFRRLIM
jgi:hypothetical protein